MGAQGRTRDRTLRVRVRAGRRPRPGEAVHRSPHQLRVVAVGPSHRQPHRNALGFGQQAAFDADLTPVRGVGTGCPPEGIWLWPLSEPFQPLLLWPQEHPGNGPFLKAQIGRGAGANTRGGQDLPLAAGG